MTTTETITVAAPSTSFAAASFCATPLLSGGIILQGLTCGSDGNPSFAPPCFPGGSDFVAGLRSSATSATVELYFTSIFTCPTGYSNALSTTRNGETRVACCPSEYSFTTSKDSIFTWIDRFWCHSTLTGGQTVTQHYCQGGNSGGTEIASTVAVVTQTGNDDGSRFDSVFITASPGDWGLEMFPDKNFAPPIQMLVKPISTPHSTTAETTSTSPVFLSTSTSTGKDSGSHASFDNGLSTIAQIIIGVVVPSVVIIIGIAIFVAYRVRKKRKQLALWWGQTSQPGNQPDQAGYQKPELAGNVGISSVGTQHQQPELGTNLSAELPGPGSRIELENDFRRSAYISPKKLNVASP
ncbi:hypothetical protein BDV96DRAFT_675402 [Lophiotrema nucula]|uniref:Mid2 domain-containing protein n=1 Tax=Lophiotrema nucula TaxID=690887 RepID=A0A6A5YGK3_9PLEO|nr:hypothetical protein BDV96DRAFT_675402 [Lophiotrema nucula]